jgi:hypothetical protein
MFIYPAASLTKYNIANNDIIIIGEKHVKNLGTSLTVQNTWDFITQKMKEGYTVDMELAPDFHKNADAIIKHMESVNIKNTLRNIKKLNRIKEINGLDFRRKSEFFGIFGNRNIQAYFFNQSPELNDINIWQFLIVVDNISQFVNNHYYKKFKDFILKINPKLLDDLFKMHKKVDNYSKYLKNIILKDSKTKPQGFIYSFGYTYNLLPNNKRKFWRRIVTDYRDFILLFSDILTLIEILFHKNNKHILLIGDAHAQNLKTYLGKYVTYPYIHPKLSKKDQKFLGKESKPYHVFIKFFK